MTHKENFSKKLFDFSSNLWYNIYSKGKGKTYNDEEDE